MAHSYQRYRISPQSEGAKAVSAPSQPTLLRVEQAAEFLNVKPSTVRAWLLKRKLPYVRVGARAVRIPRASLEKLVSEGTVPAREDRHAR